jgi:hypothetical protein
LVFASQRLSRPPHNLTPCSGVRGSAALLTEHKTWVHHIFEGILTNETKCMHCETVRTRDECFLDLSVDIEQNTSISACLRSANAMLCSF